jgi:hypothetical protein
MGRIGKPAARGADVLAYVLPSVPRAASRIGGRRVRTMDGFQSNNSPRYRPMLCWPRCGDLLLAR